MTEEGAKTKRVRKYNFSNREVEILLREILACKDIINTTIRTHATNLEKMATWKTICEKVNTCGVATRTALEVREKWGHLKKAWRARKAECLASGGEKPVPPMEHEAAVCAIMGDYTNIVTGIQAEVGGTFHIEYEDSCSATTHSQVEMDGTVQVKMEEDEDSTASHAQVEMDYALQVKEEVEEEEVTNTHIQAVAVSLLQGLASAELKETDTSALQEAYSAASTTPYSTVPTSSVQATATPSQELSEDSVSQPAQTSSVSVSTHTASTEQPGTHAASTEPVQIFSVFVSQPAQTSSMSVSSQAPSTEQPAPASSVSVSNHAATAERPARNGQLGSQAVTSGQSARGGGAGRKRRRERADSPLDEEEWGLMRSYLKTGIQMHESSLRCSEARLSQIQSSVQLNHALTQACSAITDLCQAQRELIELKKSKLLG